MGAYLYAFNPSRWPWLDQGDAIHRVNNGLPYDIYWSCGTTKRIDIGDKFFLMRVGIEPKGIIGCGRVVSKPYEAAHWDVEKAAAGMMALRTDLWFEALSHEPILSLADLEGRFEAYNWTPHSSGVTVPDGIADEIFSEIVGSGEFGSEPGTERELQRYIEGRPKRVTVTNYDRSAGARQACIQAHGHKCSVCDFDFVHCYGEIGRGYVEVHHVRALADIGEEYEINPVEDLRPVCANCHRMLHQRRPAFGIDELRGRMPEQS